MRDDLCTREGDHVCGINGTYNGLPNYSTAYFEEMAQQAREAEGKRVEAGVTVGNLDMEFAVYTWNTDRESILKAIEIILDKMLEVDGRSTGTFKVTVGLPDIAEDRASDSGRCN